MHQCECIQDVTQDIITGGNWVQSRETSVHFFKKMSCESVKQNQKQEGTNFPTKIQQLSTHTTVN